LFCAGIRNLPIIFSAALEDAAQPEGKRKTHLNAKQTHNAKQKLLMWNAKPIYYKKERPTQVLSKAENTT
jgi:hypothetical protein